MNPVCYCEDFTTHGELHYYKKCIACGEKIDITINQPEFFFPKQNELCFTICEIKDQGTEAKVVHFNKETAGSFCHTYNELYKPRKFKVYSTKLTFL